MYRISKYLRQIVEIDMTFRSLESVSIGNDIFVDLILHEPEKRIIA